MTPGAVGGGFGMLFDLCRRPHPRPLVGDLPDSHGMGADGEFQPVPARVASQWDQETAHFQGAEFQADEVVSVVPLLP